MASPHHSNIVAATRSFDGGKNNTGSNVTPAGKDDARQDTAYQLQQQQCATVVGYHTTSESSSRAFRCTACDRQFASRKYLSMHMALHKMAAERPPKLPPIAVAVGSDVRTARRQARIGSAPDQWSCPVCQKTFAQNSNFRNHVRTHSDERPYVCLVCLIGFKERYHLKKHMLFKHTGQLNEACRLCGKRFKDLTAVRAHERTHSDARPYACSRCDRMFKTSECLWHHQNRSKTCSRITATGSRSRPSNCHEMNASAGSQSSSKRRQRRSHATRRSLPSTMSDSRPSTTKAADVVESSSVEATTSALRNTARCAVSSDVKLETEIAELFDCRINALWKSLASDGVALQSIPDDSVDINICTSANCFDNLIATTTADATVIGNADILTGCSEHFWNRAAPTDLSSENDHRLQSSFVVSSSDAAFQTVSRYSERRPLYQTTPGYSIQQSRADCVYDEQSIRGCSIVPDAYESGRSSKGSPANSQVMVELADSNGAFSGSYLPTAIVAPIRHDRHRGRTPSPRQRGVSPLPAKTFHLPPIETFAPRQRLRRPLVWSSSSFPLDVPTDRLCSPYQYL